MIQRKDYLDQKVTHAEYYSQFVTEDIKRNVVRKFGKTILLNSYMTDRHLNNIPLKQWDTLTVPFGTADKLKQAGDYLTQAALHVIEEEIQRLAIWSQSYRRHYKPDQKVWCEGSSRTHFRHLREVGERQ